MILTLQPVAILFRDIWNGFYSLRIPWLNNMSLGVLMMSVMALSVMIMIFTKFFGGDD